jgi:hypothetical protein
MRKEGERENGNAIRMLLYLIFIVWNRIRYGQIDEGVQHMTHYYKLHFMRYLLICKNQSYRSDPTHSSCCSQKEE